MVHIYIQIIFHLKSKFDLVLCIFSLQIQQQFWEELNNTYKEVSLRKAKNLDQDYTNFLSYVRIYGLDSLYLYFYPHKYLWLSVYLKKAYNGRYQEFLLWVVILKIFFLICVVWFLEICMTSNLKWPFY